MSFFQLIPLIILTIVAFSIFILFFRQKTRLYKERKILEVQNKKLQEISNKNKESLDYEDFTNGHLYQ